MERGSEHAVRERRLDGIRDAVEQFAFDLGLVIAGHDPVAGSLNHDLTARLQGQLRPFLDAGDAMCPDFGAFGDLRIEGELLQTDEPVLATLEFDDRCARQTAQGRLVAAPGRRLRITMHITVDPPRVIGCAVSEAPERRG
jgi:hypothetical protein